MPDLLWIAYALMVLIVIGGVWRAKQLWRDETAELDQFSVHFRRAVPLQAAVAVAMAVFAPLVLLGGSDAASAPRLVGAVGFTVTVVLGTMLWGAIRFAGRPRGLIPPHLRGATASRRTGGRPGRRARRRAREASR